MLFQTRLQLRTIGKGTYRILVLPTELNHTLQQRNITRVLVTLDDRLTYHAPLLSLGDNRGRYVMVNAEQRRQLDLRDGDTVRVQLAVDESPYGMPVPIEWQTLLEDDAALRDQFDALPAAKQRRLLYTVGKPRQEATRLRKAVGAAAYLLEVGAENFSSANLLEWLRRVG